MKKVLQRGLPILFLFICLSSKAQKFSIEPGIGLGRALNIEGNANTKGKASIFAGLFFQATDRLSLGLEAWGTGSFIALVGGNPNSLEYDESTQTTVIGNGGVNANTQLLKLRYFFPFRDLHPYLGIGLGKNTFFYRWPVENVSIVKQHNFAIAPELGVPVDQFFISARYLIGGSTPDFVFLDNQGQRTVLESEVTSIFLVALTYRFKF